MRFASRAGSFGRTHQDDSERSPGRRANEAVRDGAAHSETEDCRVDPAASILVARLSMSHLVPLLEFTPTGESGRFRGVWRLRLMRAVTVRLPGLSLQSPTGTPS